MRRQRRALGLYVVVLVLGLSAAQLASAAERSEHFDRDPGWEGHNNRAMRPEPRSVKQDFGYSRTNHAGGSDGEMGGLITPAAEAAYYATKISGASFEQPLAASGSFACDEGSFHVLVGFFNSGTLNEWRTPNTIALRLSGRGKVFYAFLEYATSRWRTGGDSPQSFPMTRRADTGRSELTGFATDAVHKWTINYDPQANDSRGAITATIDGVKSVCHLDREHRQDGATFDRFGLLTVMKSADSGGEVWLDDVTINGRREDFNQDPQWDGFQNRCTHTSAIVRPRFDFGFSPTEFAGGQSRGELGGVVFRGDCRYPERMAHYADRLEELSLERPIKAGGRVCLRRGVTDSGVLIGFFDSRSSIVSNPAQDSGLPRNFLGISTDAPSREGFYFAPTYRIGDTHGGAGQSDPPRIYPDGKAHDWTFRYSPLKTGGGEIEVALDGQITRLPMPAGHRMPEAHFDRFGIITTWVDGNSQTIYFDDLTYTFRQD